MKTYIINGHEVNEVWLAEFRGVFISEASVLIVRKRLKSGLWTYSPAITIDFRDYNLPVLEEIAANLGGWVHGPYHNPGPTGTNYPRCRWRVDGFTLVEPILHALLEHPCLPAAKLDEASYVLDFIQARKRMPKTHYGDANRTILKTYFEGLKNLRVSRNC